MRIRITAVGPIVLAGMLWTLDVPAASGIVITAVESPAWAAHDGNKTALASGERLQNGYRLLTGDTGRLALQLEAGGELQLDVDSEIEIVADAASESASAALRLAIKIHRGRLCAQVRARAGAAGWFELQLGDSVTTTIQERGRICAEYSEEDSRIALAEGSVQIINHIEPTMVVLSKPGSEYRFDDSGQFELGTIATVMSIEVENDATPLSGATKQDEAGDSGTENAVVTETGTADGDAGEVAVPVVDEPKSGYVYTAYLFSTRSQAMANAVNRKLQEAGHRTLVITSDSGATTQYRVAVSGFTSRQAAQDYAATIIGTHGIEDTWIGRKKVGR